ncbi:MAG: hypothetical protein QXG98_00100 [Candidatus Micrarchaeia archaeon]
MLGIKTTKKPISAGTVEIEPVCVKRLYNRYIAIATIKLNSVAAGNQTKPHATISIAKIKAANAAIMTKTIATTNFSIQPLDRIATGISHSHDLDFIVESPLFLQMG